MNEIHIVSAIVHAAPEYLENAVARASAHGARIHAQSPDGRFVITLESDNRPTILDTLDALRSVTGVIAVSLVYHHCEPEHTMQKSVHEHHAS